MNEIMKIKDDHKRAFAFGFKYLFDAQRDKMNQFEFAKAADVAPATITNILKGYEDRFPGWKAQNLIASVFDTTVFNIVDIGKKIQAGAPVNHRDYLEDRGPVPKHSDKDVQDFLSRFNLSHYRKGLEYLSAYEEELVKISRSFNGDKRFLQDLYDMAVDLFVSYQSEVLKNLKR
jgi:DNA-binding XRE family transcriptional regulator